ncbi:hypothetical protein HN789_04215 [archaeon]|jgi:hypothetical protein|nr:hypothetical protein [archaeon]MBT4023153.1 hypothetical protein [archaeon]MBT4271844.1 hypothetical protein [archaeon]MBT4460732.1 hypothetical protein [archaeon]MBT4859091.1 hypothetical protein [archaeon]
MKHEDSLFISIFIMFLGFLIFTLNMVNQKILIFSYLNSIYVLAFFGSIIISIIGLGMLLFWHVENKKPFFEKTKQNHFPNYLGIGMVLVFIGLTVLIKYAKIHLIIYIMSASISIMGIIFLLLGLEYFIREVFIQKSE